MMKNLSSKIVEQLSLFLSKPKLKIYHVTGIVDGINSHRYAADYKMVSGSGHGNQPFKIRLGKGGGGLWRFESRVK